MKKKEIIERILQALQDCGVEDTMCMDENTHFEAIGVDCLDRTQICMNIEISFDVEIDNEDCFEMKTIGELADIVLKRIEEKNR